MASSLIYSGNQEQPEFLAFSRIEMSPSTNPAQTRKTRSDRQLTVFMAHACSQPLRLVGQAEASLSSYAVFWSVAACEGRTQIEVANETGLSPKTVSRVIASIGTARDGMGWIKQVPDEDDRRLRRLFLSHKGKALHARMLKDLRRIGSALA